MKRIIVICLVALLLVPAFAMPAMAADNLAFRGPEVIRAGEIISVTFCTGNFYKGVYGGSGNLSYNKDQLTLVKYTPVLEEGWNMTFFGDYFEFTDTTKANPAVGNAAIFTIEFLVNEDLPVGTKVSITAKDVVLNNGKTDIAVGMVTWTKKIAVPLNKDANLQSLSVQGFMLSPAFAPDQQSYVVYLPYEVDNLRIAAKTSDRLATLEIPAVESIPVGRSDYEVIITAQNGDTKVYTITVVRADSVLAPEVTPEETPEEIPEETEPVTEPTEPVTEPAEEATEPVQETVAETVPANTNANSNRLSDKTIGLLWISSVVAAFVGGFVAPMLIWNKD